jgi:LSD1 subclass zinc finger protein
MPTTMNCPGCRNPLRLRDGLAGRTIKCPRCAQIIAVPAEGAALVAEAPVSQTREKENTTRLCPECGETLAVTASRCSSCRAMLYKPCPRCGEEGAKRIAWTPWGSYLGPLLFTHVRCPVCGYAYNGKSGRSNAVPAIFLVAVPLLLILAILAALGWIIHHRGYW